MLIGRAKSICGELHLPGDKSISHRVAMIAALATGDTVIENYAVSADCASTLGCLRDLGVTIERDGTTIKIHGVGRQGLSQPAGPLDCGNSGTTIRLLAGVLAGQNFDSILVGDESLSKRPMKRIIAPLQAMGADIESDNGHAPLTIHGGKMLRGIDHTLQIASAQIKSCILLAGLNADGRTNVIEPAPTRDHTELMLQWFGAKIDATQDESDGRISVKGAQTLKGVNFSVPGDISSAAFFLVAAACLPGSELTLRGVGLNPTRTGIIEVLRGLGVDLKIENETTVCNEPVGDLIVRGRTDDPMGSKSNLIGGKIIANLIDEIPILAILGTQLEHRLEIRDAAELRVKESDRIAAVVENLRRMNASVEEFPDGFRVARSDLVGARIDSFGDHRIAMAFAVAGRLADGETEINGAECVDISFPGFFETLASVVSS